ncbi:hypothetical protein BOX15_Mlig002418g1 [Macrostomum lignano]|uniref:Uncharacterized protein n=2 Tax=Macrostomum lignano TaxID=282301 RepID=A0A267E043_9PLAT|nr:hypothetical protein BOX15_Mlig002418g1 [Macrostomum lignano]
MLFAKADEMLDCHMQDKKKARAARRSIFRMKQLLKYFTTDFDTTKTYILSTGVWEQQDRTVSKLPQLGPLIVEIDSHSEIADDQVHHQGLDVINPTKMSLKFDTLEELLNEEVARLMADRLSQLRSIGGPFDSSVVTSVEQSRAALQPDATRVALQRLDSELGEYRRRVDERGATAAALAEDEKEETQVIPDDAAVVEQQAQPDRSMNEEVARLMADRLSRLRSIGGPFDNSVVTSVEQSRAALQPDATRVALQRLDSELGEYRRRVDERGATAAALAEDEKEETQVIPDDAAVVEQQAQPDRSMNEEVARLMADRLSRLRSIGGPFDNSVVTSVEQSRAALQPDATRVALQRLDSELGEYRRRVDERGAPAALAEDEKEEAQGIPDDAAVVEQQAQPDRSMNEEVARLMADRLSRLRSIGGPFDNSVVTSVEQSRAALQPDATRVALQRLDSELGEYRRRVDERGAPAL